MIHQGSQFQEWRHLTAQEPIRQGDILRAVNPSADPWRQWLIVITSDCDLAHAKHDGAISCVSVLHHENYLSRFRIERLSLPIEERLIRAILKILSISATQNINSSGRFQVSPVRMSSWIIETNTEAIISACNVTPPVTDKLAAHIDSYRSLIQAKESTSLSVFLDAAAAAKLILGEGKSKSSIKAGIAKELAASLKSLPGDALFINSLADDAREGYVAYLRRIHEIGDLQIARSTVSVPQHAQYYRMGRLSAPYIYALTQQVGAVFSAIGLPTEYETQRSETVELFNLVYSEE